MINYLYIKYFLALIICCCIISLGITSSAIAQIINDNNEKKINYTHHKTKVNGILIHYVIGGKGDPIVLLHGWPQTWYEWRNIIQQLIGNNYTVIASDLRGLGDSEKPQTGYDTKNVAEDVSISKKIRI